MANSTIPSIMDSTITMTDDLMMEDMATLTTVYSIDEHTLANTFPFIPSPESETVDIADKCLPQFPISPRGPPDRSPLVTALDFQVSVNSVHVNRKTFLYSNRLNRIYVDMKKNFSLQFSWNQRLQPDAAMFVRATAVFVDEAQAQNRPRRCTQHFHEACSANLQKEMAENVLHSASDVGSQGIYYCGVSDAPDYWYSVLVHFDKTSDEPCTHAFKFVCKNSCNSGINRRALAIIFTLEDTIGQVYGRQMVGARVCACPKRDMNKDEEELGKTGKKRRCQPAPALPGNNPPAGKVKRIKTEELKTDDNVYTLPPLRVIGARPLIAGLKVMQQMMELAAECRQTEPEATVNYNECITQFKSIIDGLSSPSPE